MQLIIPLCILRFHRSIHHVNAHFAHVLVEVKHLASGCFSYDFIVVFERILLLPGFSWQVQILVSYVLFYQTVILQLLFQLLQSLDLVQR